MLRPLIRVTGAIWFVLSLVLALAACGESAPSAEEHLARALEYREKGDLQAASIELKNALQAAPNNPEARLGLARLHLEIGDGASAEKEFRRAIELEAPVETLAVDLIRSLLLQGKLEEVVEVNQFMAGLGSKADRAEISALTGHAQLGLRELSSAETLYDAALEIDPTSSEARLGKARLAIARSRLDDAHDVLEKLLADDPDFATAWSLKGDLESSTGNAQQAEQSYSQAITHRVDNSADLLKRALVRIAQDDYENAASDVGQLKSRGLALPGVAYGEGLLLFHQKEYAKAKTAFQDALKRDPNYMPAVYYLGLTSYVQGEMEQADQYLGRFLKRFPASSDAAKKLATVRMMQGDLAAAEALLQPLLARAPDDPETLNLLSFVTISQGKSKEGVSYLERVVAEHRDSATAHAALGLGLLMDGEHEKSIRELETARELSPEFQEADILVILTHLRGGELDKALAAAARFRDRQPDSPLPLNFIGLVHLQKGEEASARQVFEQALELSPGDPAATNNLGMMAMRAGESDRARELYQKALEYHPGHLGLLLQLAALETSAGQIEAAKSLLEQARDARPKALQPRVFLARYFLNTAQPQRALSTLREVREEHSGNLIYLATLGEAELAAGQPAQAATTLEALVRLQPESPQAHYLLARAFLDLHEVDSARAALERSIALQPTLIPAQIMNARLLMQANRTEEANAVLEYLKQLAPKHPEVLGLEGWLAMRQGRPDDAVTALEATAAIAQSGQLILDLADAQWMSKDWEGSLATQEKWLESNPTDFKVRTNLAQYYLLLNRNEEAQGHLMTVVESFPDHLPALNNLAWLLRAKSPEQALLYAERALELAPSSPAVMDTLGVILLGQGETERALRVLETASEKSPADLQIRYHVARALADSGKKDEAKSLLREILAEQKLFLEITEARTLLEELGG